MRRYNRITKEDHVEYSTHCIRSGLRIEISPDIIAKRSEESSGFLPDAPRPLRKSQRDSRGTSSVLLG